MPIDALTNQDNFTTNEVNNESAILSLAVYLIFNNLQKEKRNCVIITINIVI